MPLRRQRAPVAPCCLRRQPRACQSQPDARSREELICVRARAPRPPEGMGARRLRYLRTRLRAAAAGNHKSLQRDVADVSVHAQGSTYGSMRRGRATIMRDLSWWADVRARTPPHERFP